MESFFKLISKKRIMQKRRSGSMFLFHNIGNDSDYTKHLHVTISRERFKKILKQIKDTFTIVPYSIFLKNMEDPSLCAITFDDGLKSFETEALPIMKEFDIPSTMFLNWQPLLGELPWINKLSYIMESHPKEIRELCDKIGIRRSFFMPTNISKFIESFSYPKTPVLIEDSFKKIKGNYQLLSNNSSDVYEAFLSIEDVERLSKDSLIEWGSHTLHHYPLEKLSIDQIKEEITIVHI